METADPNPEPAASAAETSEANPTAVENPAPIQRGRPFVPGQSGNPSGRPRGARNKATRRTNPDTGGLLPPDEQAQFVQLKARCRAWGKTEEAAEIGRILDLERLRAYSLDGHGDEEFRAEHESELKALRERHPYLPPYTLSSNLKNMRRLFSKVRRTPEDLGMPLERKK